MKIASALIRILSQPLVRRMPAGHRAAAGLGTAALLLLASAPQASAILPSTATTLAVTFPGSGTLTAAPAGTVVTLTATVKAGSTPVAAGTVNFCDASATYCTDIHLLGTAQLTAAGTASIKLIPSHGSHSYKAVFVGTTGAATSASASAALQVAGSYPTTTTIAAGGSAGNYTLTATVTGSGVAAPTGLVSFLDTDNANYVLGSMALGTGSSVFAFSGSTTSSTGIYPTFVVAGDFNGDGIPDLAIADNGSNTVTILLGVGDGTFTPASASPATGALPYAAVVGDFNADGKLDLAVANAADGTISVLLGDGDGSFTPAVPVSTGIGSSPVSLAAADFNGDGKLDLAAIDANTNSVLVLLGDGAGGFLTAAGSPSTGINPVSIAAGDLNGNGIPDLVVANSGDNTISALLGNGDGSFTAQTPLATGSTPISVAIGDLKNNGKADLAVANFGGNAITVYLGDGSGNFTAAASPVTGTDPAAIAIGDFNGDGVADLATANFGDSTLTVLLGKGDGTFTAAAAPAVGSYPYSIAAAVFHAGGLATPAVVNLGDSTVNVLQSQITQTATAAVNNISIVGTGTHNVDASYAGDSTNGASISSTIPLAAQQVATTLVLTQTPATAVYGHPVVITATISPAQAQGHNISGTVTFSNAGTTLATVNVSGASASTTVTTLPVGVESLLAVYSGDTNFLGSQATSGATDTITSDFSFTAPANASHVVFPGGLASYTFQIAPLPANSNYPGVITFSAAGLPAGATASFSPSSIPVSGGAQPVVMTVQTASVAAANHAPATPFNPLLLGMLLLPLAGARRILRAQRRFARWTSLAVLSVLSLAAVAGLAGCGSSAGFFAQRPQSYTITVTATGGTVTHSAAVNLTVQ